jgi:type IV secretion system protein VirB4
MALNIFTSLKKPKDVAGAQIPVSDYIPFGVHTTRNVIKLRADGDLCATWRLHGIPFETASPAQIGDAKRQLVNFLHSIRGTDFSEPCAVWVHRVRRSFTDVLKARFATEYARSVDEKYNASLAHHEMLRNELYFTLVLRPSVTASGSVRKLRTRSAEGMNEFDLETHERFSILCNQATSSLQKYGVQRLGCDDRFGINGETIVTSEMLTFYQFLLTGVWEDVDLQESTISNYLCGARIFAGDRNGIVQVNHPTKRTFVGYLDLLDYPTMTEPGMMNCLFYGPYQFVETQSFSFKSKRDGLDAVKLQQNRLISGGEGSAEQIAEMETAMEDARNGRVYFGEYHYTLGVCGNSVEAAQQAMASARTSLQEDAGYKVATVDLIPECAHFAQLPGNWKWRPRTANITTRNFAALAPMHNFDLGKRDGNPWGQAIVMLRTPSGQPYYLNLHDTIYGKDRTGEKDAGHVFICGRAGTGKSVLLNFMNTMLEKVADKRTLFFDNKRGSELYVRANGGIYRQLKRAQPTGFNPFQWEPTPATIKFVQQLVMQCARRSPDEVLGIDVENGIIQAVGRVFLQPDKSTRRISAVLQHVGENSLIGERLAKWCRTDNRVGTNSWVLDNAVDTTDFSKHRLFGFDYTDFLNDQEIGPVIIAYILEAANTLINGQPFICVMEEFAQIAAAKSQIMVNFARTQLETIRSKNGLCMFVTQSPSQVNKYEIGKTLREQCITQIYLPNPGADHEDYVNGFNLTESEFEIIKNLREDSRQFLVKQGERSTLCELNLYGMSDELQVLSADLESVARCEQIRHELNSDDPAVWLPVFYERSKQLKRHTSASIKSVQS